MIQQHTGSTGNSIGHWTGIQLFIFNWSQHLFLELRGAKAWPCPTRPSLFQGRDIFTLYKTEGKRYAGSAILSPRQASQSQQAACSTTPCSVWTSGEPHSGARGRSLKQPQRKKKRDPVVERRLGDQWGGDLYTTYIRGYIYAVYLYMCVLI